MDSETLTARPWLAESPPGVPADADLTASAAMADLLAKGRAPAEPAATSPGCLEA